MKIKEVEKSDKKEKKKSSPHIEKRRRGNNIVRIATAFWFIIATLTPSCVYHRKGSSIHALKYDHRDAIVAFPWVANDDRVEKDFEREYELSITASIGIWFAGIIEIGDVINDFPQRFHHLPIAFFPSILYAIQTDRNDIQNAIDRAKALKENP